MNNMEHKLAKIQSLIKAPKGQYNSFGKYKYRSCEDIVEAVKPVINPMGFFLTLSDEVVEVGGRLYVKATATISDGTETYSSTAFAREEETKKGMDGSQITGASSSYARKYALNGLFAIDDTKDADSTNTHDDKEMDAAFDNVPTDGEKQILRNLVFNSTLDEAAREKAFLSIEACTDYTKYQQIQHRLEDVQKGFDDVPNPNGKDINKKVRQRAGAEA